MSAKRCEKCQRWPRVPTYRYCRKCIERELREMRRAGYLQEVPEGPWLHCGLAKDLEDSRTLAAVVLTGGQ